MHSRLLTQFLIALSFFIIITQIFAVSSSSFSLKFVSAGGFHSLVLDDDGIMYSWGLNNHGQLGDGTTTDSSTPVKVINTKVLSSKTIVQLSCGEFHSLALDTDGIIFSFGANSNGELGDGTLIDRLEPVNVQFSATHSKIVKISAGVSHNLAIDQDGKIYSWGSQSCGELGDRLSVDYFDKKDPQTQPVAVNITSIVDNNLKIVDISAGNQFSLLRDSGGGLISFGLNNQGQLGFPNTGTEKSSNYCPFPHVDFPTRISFTFGNKITSFATGADHAVAVDENGKVFAFGHNYDGQIGDGTWKDKFFPIEITTLNGSRIEKAFAGLYSSLLVDHEGKMFGIGDNYGIRRNIPYLLFNPNDINPNYNTILKFDQMSIFKSHVIALSTNSQIFGKCAFTWGQNEKGQLGDRGKSEEFSHFPIPIRCKPGFNGPNCEFPICFQKSLFENPKNQICSGNGNCDAPNNCKCNSKFFGSECENYDNRITNLAEFISKVYITIQWAVDGNFIFLAIFVLIGVFLAAVISIFVVLSFFGLGFMFYLLLIFFLKCYVSKSEDDKEKKSLLKEKSLPPPTETDAAAGGNETVLRISSYLKDQKKLDDEELKMMMPPSYSRTQSDTLGSSSPRE